MKKSIVLALVALVSATGAAAAAPAEPAPEREKKICKTEKMTGSRTRVTRICLTRAQWNELSGITRDGVEDMTRYGGGQSDANRGPGG